MKIYEFGDISKPVILLLPGTCCYWKANFGSVIDLLTAHFLVAVVSYSGFDETEQTEFVSMLSETEKIETYILAHYDGNIHVAYGCSLGGSFVGLLISRERVHINHGIIGSSDMDECGPLMAKLQSMLMTPLLQQLVATGRLKNRLLNHVLQKSMKKMGTYGEKLLSMFGIGEYDLSFITKTSIKNQFYTDLITPLPEQISVAGTQIHVFYAEKMGAEYRKRYEKYFKNPDILTQNLQHEELLAVYPTEWVKLVEKVCGI